MLQLHKSLASAKTPGERNVLQRQVDGTDRQIDQLVYALYGLTDDEIKIVEETSRVACGRGTSRTTEETFSTCTACQGRDTDDDIGWVL